MDTYALNARLRPALLVALPIGVAIVSWFPDRFMGWGLLTGILSSCGLTMLLSEFVRDQGKRIEPLLYQCWGGTPTTQLMRHRDTRIDRNTKLRYHDKLASQIPGIRLPTADEEAVDTKDADEVYGSCVSFLRERTRDKSQFPLVFKDLVRYGFGRNLLGTRPYALSIAILGLVASAMPVIREWGAEVQPSAVAAVGINALLLTLWLAFITKAWVRSLAYSYAYRLLAACETL